MLDFYESVSIFSATAIGAVLARRLWREYVSPGASLPPSPRSYPLIGHLLSMPQGNEHLGFVEIGKELNSDIFSLSIFGTVIVVLNSSEDAVNLLEKRSGIYSDRMCPPMLADPSLVNWGNSIPMLGYNDRWKKSRRLMHPVLHKAGAETFHPSQQRQARLLLQRLLESSDHLSTSKELDDELYRTIAATLVYSIYGYNVQSLNDPFVLRVKQAIDNAGKAALPSNFLVNAFPQLVHIPDWFPGTGWKQTARKWREQQEETVNLSYDWAKANMAKGNNEPTIIESLVDDAERLGLNPDEIDDYVKQIAVMLFGAGTDTTVNTLLAFVLAMLLFSGIQTKAQNEIDNTIGFDRLPIMEDRPKLRYVDRLIQEVLRWRPAVPNAIPHACQQDDTYRGYRIPKGAIVVGNVWAINHNPNVYTNPEDFDPDRFLDSSVPLPPTFGFGRRLCPGIHYADASLFITIASILAAFDISMVKDDNGYGIVPSADGEESYLGYHPKPFRVRFAPRSDLHAKLVRTGA